MRVMLLTGSVPPQPCGVGDYVQHLAESLVATGVQAEIATGDKWKVTNVTQWMRRVRASGAQVLHIHYPTSGYGSRVGPHLLALLVNTPLVVTLHEFTQAHPLRRLSLIAFSIRSKHVLFTTTYERTAFLAWYPWIRKRSSVIPIGSNIPFLKHETGRDFRRIVWFGLIAPNKGLETFLDLARLVGQRALDYHFIVMGMVPSHLRSYFEGLRSTSRDLPVEWKLGLTSDQVAREFGQAGFTYLPYPDGASERRTSLLAALGNGATVITTHGLFTPPDFSGAMFFVSSPQEALDRISHFDLVSVEAMSVAVRECIRRFSWPQIVEAHLATYEQATKPY